MRHSYSMKKYRVLKTFGTNNINSAPLYSSTTSVMLFWYEYNMTMYIWSWFICIYGLNYKASNLNFVNNDFVNEILLQKQTACTCPLTMNMHVKYWYMVNTWSRLFTCPSAVQRHHKSNSHKSVLSLFFVFQMMYIVWGRFDKTIEKFDWCSFYSFWR